MTYGDGVADRIRRAAGQADAFIDTFGADYVQLALELGVKPARIDTIVNFGAVQEYGVKAEANAARGQRKRASRAGGASRRPASSRFQWPRPSR